MLIRKFLNKDTYKVPEAALLIVSDIKSAVYMANIVKYSKHFRHISRRVIF